MVHFFGHFRPIFVQKIALLFDKLEIDKKSKNIQLLYKVTKQFKSQKNFALSASFELEIASFATLQRGDKSAIFATSRP